MRAAVLFITPVMPAPGGNGLAMRAGTTLDGLARDFDVHLFVVPVSDPSPRVTSFVTNRAVRAHVLDLAAHVDTHAALIARVGDPMERLAQRLRYPRPWLARCCTESAFRTLSAWAGGTAFSVVHIFRLHLAPFGTAVAGDNIARVLDLDDDEVRTREAMAELHAAAGNADAATLERAEARTYCAFAKHWFPRFDVVLTSAAADAERLGRLFPRTRFSALANGYSPAETPAGLQPRPEDAPLRILFVGTLGYPPNTDAALFLCRDILPLLRDRTGGPVRIDLVGAGAPRELVRAARDAGAVMHGQVPALAPIYEAADVAAVPLRAGGGTRIKILEAFAHGVPVVSTAIGAEGLDLVAGRDFLRADTPAGFAEACVSVAADPALAERLRDAGRVLLHDRYGAINVQRDLARIYDSVRRPAGGRE